MAGRDIGTVVCPEAEIKIYLEASLDERTRRRYLELIARGKIADQKEIRDSLNARDRIDSTRTVAPLRPAEDAVIINTDDLAADMLLKKVMRMITRYRWCRILCCRRKNV